MRPAGFWRRGAAWSLDAALVALPVLVLCRSRLQAGAATTGNHWNALVDAVAQRMADAIMAADATVGPDPATLAGLARGWLDDPVLLDAAAALQSSLLAMAGPPLLAFVALFLAWCVGFECSALQATPGKRALGLRVVGAAGGRIGPGAALLRFLAGTLSWLSLNIGHMLAALPPGHLALHDRLSRTRVVLEAHAARRMPAWASAWLALQAVLFALGTASLAHAVAITMHAALERAMWG